MKKSFKPTGTADFDAALEKMDNTMSLKNHAFATCVSYLRGLREQMCYYQKLPENCSVDDIKAFLVFQRDERKYSSST